uniref:RING-type E3 ubiquitin transferase n=1 Tax=Leersia perrieri TaxID=77586 RepID=A0A0D9WCY0_9ORYZ
MAASEEDDTNPSTRRKKPRLMVEAENAADALDCGVCFLPLRPPIFQCPVGHVVCSPCRDKLARTCPRKCHVCGVAVVTYRRCHAMEKLVDSIHVACPHAAHGCAATPAYHELESHRDTCPHAPNCHCPGDGCGFVGSTAALLDHFAAAAPHDWPCTDQPVDQSQPQERLQLPPRLLCIHPHEVVNMRCELVILWLGGGGMHHQQSIFNLGCSDLADGLPDPKHRSQFLCHVGHVVCSTCRDKLAPAGKCHVCGVAVAGYRRCHAMEKLVDSIRVACPHAAHGCPARPPYHSLDAHRLSCTHAPCHCPGKGCGIVGSTAELLDHFADEHDWPCTDVSSDHDNLAWAEVHLNDCFNFLSVDHHIIIMMNMTSVPPLDRAISVLCIRPRAAAAVSEMKCELKLFNDTGGSHYQKSQFQLDCSDLADGLPDDLKYRCQMVVPAFVAGDDNDDGIGTNCHVVCSPCRDKLSRAPVPKCHVCGVAVAGYSRCHAMEKLVDSIRVACPHAAHGCAATPAYHELESHRDTCPHDWPRTDVSSNYMKYRMADFHLKNGFNFIAVDGRPPTLPA